jgi:hypothetical protein
MIWKCCFIILAAYHALLLTGCRRRPLTPQEERNAASWCGEISRGDQFYVTTTQDTSLFRERDPNRRPGSEPGPVLPCLFRGPCPLRDAVYLANLCSRALRRKVTVNLPPGDYALASADPDGDGRTALATIQGSVEVVGSVGGPRLIGEVLTNRTRLIADPDAAGGNLRHFAIASGGTLALRQIALANGRVIADGGSVYIAPDGSMQGTVVTFEDNAAGDGGAIRNHGMLELADCSFARNAAQRGGAIMTTRDVSLWSCCLDADSASEGGAVYVGNDDAKVLLVSSTIVAAHALTGAALMGFGSFELQRTTISGCSAEQGGIVAGSALTGFHSTIADNTCRTPGAAIISVVELGMRGLLVAGNHGAANCAVGSMSSPEPRTNVSDDTSCAGFSVGDARLGPLEPVPGSRCGRGHRPGPESAAIDVAGDECEPELPTGWHPPCDAGAVEVPPTN